MINAYIYTNVGKYRENNQDGIILDEKLYIDANEYLEEINPYMLAVFDGVGGEFGGDKATEIAAKTLSDRTRNISNVSSDQLYEIVKTVNEQVIVEAEKDEKYIQMATVFTSLVFDKSKIHVLNTGDCRTYKAALNVLIQISTDHSISRGSNVIVSYLGKNDYNIDDLNVFTIEDGLGKSAKLLMSSDGFHDYVNMDKVCDIVNSDNSLTEIGKDLVSLVEATSPRDNISFVVIEECK